MRLTRLAVLAALTAVAPAAVSFAADMPAGHPPIEGTRQITPPSHSGEVQEAIPAAGYIYLHVTGTEGDEWLAAPATDLKPGAKINWNDGMVMRDFTSKTLNRTFATIRFVEIVEPAK